MTAAIKPERMSLLELYSIDAYDTSQSSNVSCLCLHNWPTLSMHDCN